MKIALINGPNLNLLGVREPDIYGKVNLKDIVKMVKREAKKSGARVKAFQSNHEGKIIDFIHRIRRKNFNGIIINPGAFTHYSIAIRDAIKAVNIPTVEVHISDIEKREEFRKLSVIKDVCITQIKGMGPKGYIEALHVLLKGAR